MIFLDPIVRCRWSTNSADPSLFIKYDKNKLNILDAEQQKLILTEPFKVDNDPSNSLPFFETWRKSYSLLFL